MEFELNKLILVTIASLTLAACSSEAPSAADETTFADSELTGNTGQVLSSVQVPGYTYIEVRNNGRTIWLAGTPVVVEEGEVISWGQSAVMRNFKSTVLDRVFEEILFVSGVYQGDAVPPQSASTAPTTQNTGTVLSTQSAAGYSYVEVETGPRTTVWLAAPSAELEVGQHIEWQGASKMTNFSSPSLGRTFEEILFVSSVK